MKLNILALGDRFSAAYSSIAHELNNLGNIRYQSEHKFNNVDEALDFIANSSFNVVIMPNPYGNKRRMLIYQKLKANNFPVIVFDRGALPDSWFFDIGFNADSDTYHPLNWDIDLDKDKLEKIGLYIDNIKKGDKALEEQGNRIGGKELKKELGIEDKKVIFVPLQRPEDTVIKFFSDGYDNFIKEIEKLQKFINKNLSNEWVLLVKKHPLETKLPSSNISYVDENTNVYDLIEASDLVVLINSGVGVLSMLYSKPVLYFGKVFYGHPAINQKVNNYLDIVYYMRKGLHVDSIKVKKFIYHLKENVYSFGDFDTEKVLQKDGSFRNITRFIDFYDFKFPNINEIVKKKFY